MLEFFLSILVDFGLLNEDYKHRKKVSQKEKEDGIKRPFQKILFQPSAIAYGIAFLIVIVTASFYFFYQNKYVYPNYTKIEISEIAEVLEKRKDKFGNYPITLDELFGNDPNRHGWTKDAWDRPYKYSIRKSDTNFTLVSAGKDGVFNNEDDIIFK